MDGTLVQQNKSMEKVYGSDYLAEQVLKLFLVDGRQQNAPLILVLLNHRLVVKLVLELDSLLEGVFHLQLEFGGGLLQGLAQQILTLGLMEIGWLSLLGALELYRFHAGGVVLECASVVLFNRKAILQAGRRPPGLGLSLH